MITIGVFVGSFNPWHEGHQYVLDQANKIFDTVVVGIGQNPNKPANDLEQLRRKIPGLCWKYQNVLQLYYKVKERYDHFFRHEGTEVTIVRGLRTEKDFIEDTKFREYVEDANIIYIPCPKRLIDVSSTKIREES